MLSKLQTLEESLEALKNMLSSRPVEDMTEDLTIHSLLPHRDRLDCVEDFEAFDEQLKDSNYRRRVVSVITLSGWMFNLLTLLNTKNKVNTAFWGLPMVYINLSIIRASICFVAVNSKFHGK